MTRLTCLHKGCCKPLEHASLMPVSQHSDKTKIHSQAESGWNVMFCPIKAILALDLWLYTGTSVSQMGNCVTKMAAQNNEECPTTAQALQVAERKTCLHEPSSTRDRIWWLPRLANLSCHAHPNPIAPNPSHCYLPHLPQRAALPSAALSRLILLYYLQVQSMNDTVRRFVD